MEDIADDIGSSSKSSTEINNDLKALVKPLINNKDTNGFSQTLNEKLNTNGLLKHVDNIIKIKDDQSECETDSKSELLDDVTGQVVSEDTLDVKCNEVLVKPEDISNGVNNECDVKNVVKQDTGEKNGDKSSFHIPLDEKLRNSLKGLVAKVKCSEESKDTNSNHSSEGEDTKSGITKKDQKHEDPMNDVEPDDTKGTDSSDALLLDSDIDDIDDGIHMDIGSDCEDALLSDAKTVEDTEVIDISSESDVKCKHSSSDSVVDNSHTNETVALGSSGSKSQDNKQDLDPDKPQSISDHKAGDKMVTNNKEVVEEDNDDVIFQKITKLTDTNTACQTNGSGHACSDNLPEVNGAYRNEPCTDENSDDVIIDKVTTAAGVDVKTSCDKTDTSVKADDRVLNGSNNPDSNSKAMDVGETIVSSSSDRKRTAENSELNENDNKRKKLHLTNGIGAASSQTSIELSDSDDEESAPVSNGEISPPRSQQNNDNQRSPMSQPKLITMTTEELNKLVIEKVKTQLDTQQTALVAKLIGKVKELQKDNSQWKRRAKDLQMKMNEATVLQTKLEKRKAATNALRKIRTRHVAVQVNNGKDETYSTSSLKPQSAPRVGRPPHTPPHAVAVASSPVTPPAMVTSPAGSGIIRLPIPQSSYNTSTSINKPGNKVLTANYKTPSVKSLLDTTKVQKTVGSVTTPQVTPANSVIGLVQYPPNFIAKPMTSQGFASINQTLVTQVPTMSTNVNKTPTKTLTLTSPTAKVIDLTEDDDGKNQTRFLALAPGVTPGLQTTMLPPGTQLVRGGTPNQPTYQVVFNPNSGGVRPVSVVSSPNSVLTGMQAIQLTSGTTMARAAVPVSPSVSIQPQANIKKHPAPFPDISIKHNSLGLKALPPKPILGISRVTQGIVLSWNMTLNDNCAKITNYQLFAYQETTAPPTSNLWKKVGDVKALPLPMACTLTQFQVGNKYHFAVRALDEHGREGPFSDPNSIHLTPTSSS